jgi:molybdenum cofactor cytidylyltransferase
MSNIAAIILAAGASSRLGQPKQLVEYLGERLLDRALRITRQANVQKIYVVLGANADLIKGTCNLAGATILINEDWATGMASSIRTGVAALPVTTQQALILTCDQPAANADHLLALLTIASHHNTNAASAYAGRIGTPAVFSERVFSDLLKLEGDTGARAFLQSADVVPLPLPDGEFDIDTPDDLAKLA